MNAEKSTFNEWALVELFGHQKIVGKVSEATLAGGAFLRVDVPAYNGQPAFTRYYGPGAIYSLYPVSEEVARGLMDHYRNEPVSRFEYRNEPVSRFELPQLAEKVAPKPDEPDVPNYCVRCGNEHPLCRCGED